MTRTRRRARIAAMVVAVVGLLLGSPIAAQAETWTATDSTTVSSETSTTVHIGCGCPPPVPTTPVAPTPDPTVPTTPVAPTPDPTVPVAPTPDTPAAVPVPEPPLTPAPEDPAPPTVIVPELPAPSSPGGEVVASTRVQVSRAQLAETGAPALGFIPGAVSVVLLGSALLAAGRMRVGPARRRAPALRSDG